MTKNRKYSRLKKTLLVLLLLLLLISTFFLALYKSSSFQTYVLNIYLNKLFKNAGFEYTLNKVSINFFDQININGLLIKDSKKDTLLFVDNLKIEIDEFSFKKKIIHIDDVELDNFNVELKKYKNDTVINLNPLLSLFSSNDTTPSNWDFQLKNIALKNGQFVWDDFNTPIKEEFIDYNHVRANKLFLNLNNIQWFKDSLSAEFNQLEFIEKSGFELKELTNNLCITNQKITFDNLTLLTDKSDISGSLNFGFNNYEDFNKFIKKVKIQSHFNNSVIHFDDLKFFAEDLKPLSEKIYINGKVKGKISSLKGRDLMIRVNDYFTYNGNIDITGLPDIDQTFIHAKVEEFITDKAGLERIPLPPFSENKHLELSNEIAQLGKIKYKGDFTGFINDFVTYGTINTKLGVLKTDIKINTFDEIPVYSGMLSSKNFDLGKLTKQEDLGVVSFKLKSNGQGFDINHLNTQISGEIFELNYKKYQYKNISVNGSFNKKMFEGDLMVKDDNLQFDFNGIIDYNNDIPHYKFNSKVSNAKLAKLYLISSKQKLKTRLSTNIYVDLAGTHIDNLEGVVSFKDIVYTDRLDTIYVDSLEIFTKNYDNQRKLIINSEILNLNLFGNFHFNSIQENGNYFISHFIPSAHTFRNKKAPEEKFEFSLQINRSKLLSKFLGSKVLFGKNTLFEGSYIAENNQLLLNSNIPKLWIYGYLIEDMKINCGSKDSIYDLKLNAQNISFGDSVSFQNFAFNSTLTNDSLISNLKWNNIKDTTTFGEIHNKTLFNGFKSIATKFTNSFIDFKGTEWRFNEDNSIVWSDTLGLRVKNLSVKTPKQGIILDGSLSTDSTSQLDLVLENVNTKILKYFVSPDILEIEGIINGVASVTDAYKRLIFTSDLKLSDFGINNVFIGSATLKSAWNDRTKSFKINGEILKGHIPVIAVNGNLSPNHTENNYDLNFDFNRTDLRIFDKYLNEYISDLRGIASGEAKLEGTFLDPQLSGNLTFQKTSFGVNYLNTSYSTPFCKVNIYPDMFFFDNVTFFDEKGNKAVSNGTLLHQKFKKWNFDISLDMKDFLVLNTNASHNELYYGRALISGFANVSGYDNKVIFELNAKSEKGTQINIPISDTYDVEENNFITFVNHDTTAFAVETKLNTGTTDVEMNFDLEVTPDAEIRLIFDEMVGDVIRAKGEGNLNMVINNQGDFNIYGQYQIKEGDYLFTLRNIINKKFSLKEGGKITFDGDPYEAQLNLSAVYKLRARLYDLLVAVDTSDVYKKRIPIEVQMNMTGVMSKPDIQFDVYLPTVEETTRERVRSILYLNNADVNMQEMNRQVFSLLVLNRFLPPPDVNAKSGGVGSGAAVNSAEVLSNQISNWLSKISNDFDIGLAYRPGDKLSNDEVEVALSTQIFNDRVVLDGNVGYTANNLNSTQTTSNNTNNIVGDFTVEYKISEDGSFRIKAFNRSNNYSLIENKSKNTQGVGVFYKEEFDSTKEFFRKFSNRFRKKDKKKAIDDIEPK